VGLHVGADVGLEVPQDGEARVHLVVNAQRQADGHVLRDVQPVQIVPETLRQPVLADLQVGNMQV